jgi:hypothetical protein
MCLCKTEYQVMYTYNISRFSYVDKVDSLSDKVYSSDQRDKAVIYASKSQIISEN